jgi:hypothetical protein
LAYEKSVDNWNYGYFCFIFIEQIISHYVAQEIFIHIHHLSIMIKLLLTQNAYATHHCTDVTLSHILPPPLSLSLALNVASSVVYKGMDMIPEIQMLTC